MKLTRFKRLAALLLTVCFMVPALAEEAELTKVPALSPAEVTATPAPDDASAPEEDDGLIVEDVQVDENGDLILEDGLPGGEEEEELAIPDEMEEVVEILDMERDDSVNPDDLELNQNLPANVVNILLVGIDTRSTNMEEGARGDVQMIVSINTDDGSIKLTSILRDLYVTLPGYKSKNRINAAYSFGGGALAMRTINHNFDMNIQYYVAINFYGLASIIDSLGGVDIELTKAEARAINTYIKKHPPRYDNQDKSTYTRQPLEQKAGVQHLDGIQAVMYARVRSIDNDFSRTARQRHLMEVLLGQVVQDMDVNKLFKLLQTCLPYAATNMSAETMVKLAMGVLRSGILERAKAGDVLVEQHRIPMDKTYSYQNVNGASVIAMGSKSFPNNVKALHEFIYGEYIPAD